jgi:hypothetical protein
MSLAVRSVVLDGVSRISSHRRVLDFEWCWCTPTVPEHPGNFWRTWTPSGSSSRSATWSRPARLTWSNGLTTRNTGSRPWTLMARNARTRGSSRHRRLPAERITRRARICSYAHPRTHQIKELGARIWRKQTDQKTLHQSERCFDHMTLPTLEGSSSSGIPRPPTVPLQLTKGTAPDLLDSRG